MFSNLMLSTLKEQSMYSILGILLGLIIYQLVIKPIKVHNIQKDLMSKGCPKPDSYKEHIWF